MQHAKWWPCVWKDNPNLVTKFYANFPPSKSSYFPLNMYLRRKTFLSFLESSKFRIQEEMSANFFKIYLFYEGRNWN